MSKTLHRLYLSLIAWTFSLLSASATPAPGQLKGVSHAASLAKPVDGQILRLATTDMLFNETFDKQWEEGEALFTW